MVVTIKRLLGAFLGLVVALMLAIVLYIAFADLGRHKSRIEAWVTQSLGRPFVIEGPLKLKLFPVVDVSAERVRLGNAPGTSRPQMIEIGKVLVQIDFWSLVSGPPDVRRFELDDATVVLERGSDGRGNWIMGPPEKEAEDTETETGAAEVPLVIRGARVHNVRLIYRQARKHDRIAQLDELRITTGDDELLALEGRGKLDEYPLSLKGELGPLSSLLAARDMRIAMHGSLGRLALDIKGVVGSLNPLDGADLTLGVELPKIDEMLRKLELPVIASGPVRIDARLKDAGERTQLNFDAKAADLKASAKGTLRTLSLVGADLTLRIEQSDIRGLLEALKLPPFATGPMRIDARVKDGGKLKQLDLQAKLGDLEASVKGTLKTPSLVGSDLKFEAAAADAARLARVFDISGVPAMPLAVTGHTWASRSELKFEALTAAIADASARADGSLQFTGDRKLALNFEATVASLAKLRDSWPEMKASASGVFESAGGRIDVKSLQAAIGETRVAGSLSLIGARQIDAQLATPRLDLSRFLPQGKPAEAEPQAQPQPPNKKFVFSETPLRIEQVKDIDAKLHLACGELVLGDRSIKDLDGNVRVENGQVTFDLRAAGAHDGTLRSAGTLTPSSDGKADLELKIDVADLRASLGTKDIARADVPPVGVTLNIRIHGGSPREMASGANGHLLLTQGAGKTRSGFITNYGGGVLAQLGEKLNPFVKDDPFVKLDCTIARADIVDGEMTVKPVVIQTEKVTITAHGTVDLRTEKLLFDFNTRPRKGIGVTPGMFTNPLIRLEGTLASPRIGVGAKGVASGALAAATGGMTVVAEGLVDRVAGEKNICKKTLVTASKPGIVP